MLAVTPAPLMTCPMASVPVTAEVVSVVVVIDPVNDAVMMLWSSNADAAKLYPHDRAADRRRFNIVEHRQNGILGNRDPVARSGRAQGKPADGDECTVLDGVVSGPCTR